MHRICLLEGTSPEAPIFLCVKRRILQQCRIHFFGVSGNTPQLNDRRQQVATLPI